MENISTGEQYAECTIAEIEKLETTDEVVRDSFVDRFEEISNYLWELITNTNGL